MLVESGSSGALVRFSVGCRGCGQVFSTEGTPVETLSVLKQALYPVANFGKDRVQQCVGNMC